VCTPSSASRRSSSRTIIRVQGTAACEECISSENLHQIYIPAGFAHGFCVLSDLADVMYKTGSYYEDRLERGISYLDPDVAIAWPEGIELSASERDSTAPLLREIEDQLPFVYEGAAVAAH
jgi:dTDP-4-dehydrorhamnose 3,5-epimerase